MFEEINADESIDSSKITLGSRLPFMDLEAFCTQHHFCYYIVWYAGYGQELSCTENLGGRVWGKYAEEIRQKGIKLSGNVAKGPSGLAGKTYAAKDQGLNEHADAPDESAGDAEKLIQELAVKHHVKSAWAIFRDGAVYEFGSKEHMPELPNEIIAGIGGVTGVAAAAKAVMATIRLGAMAKASKGKADQ